MAISTASARGEFTKAVLGAIETYAEPTLFMKSFFKTKTTEALELSLEVRRRGRRMAVDVKRGTEGNITRADKSTEKIYIPPFYDEKFNLTNLEGYRRIFGESNEISGGHWARVVSKVGEEVAYNVDAINRRYEKQASQALTTGIVTMKNGDDIDYLRKVESLVAFNAAHNWGLNTVNPGAIMETGAQFLVREGMVSPGTTFNVIMGRDAWNAFRANELRAAEGDIKDQKFQDLLSPMNFGLGAVVMGRYSYGSYNFVIWGYEGVYENESGVTTEYMDPKKIIMLPNEQTFTFGFGGTPAEISVNGTEMFGQMEGEFNYYKYNDMAKTASFFGVRSAGVAILDKIDTVWTAQVIA